MGGSSLCALFSATLKLKNVGATGPGEAKQAELQRGYLKESLCEDEENVQK